MGLDLELNSALASFFSGGRWGEGHPLRRQAVRVLSRLIVEGDPWAGRAGQPDLLPGVLASRGLLPLPGSQAPSALALAEACSQHLPHLEPLQARAALALALYPTRYHSDREDLPALAANLALFLGLLDQGLDLAAALEAAVFSRDPAPSLERGDLAGLWRDLADWPEEDPATPPGREAKDALAGAALRLAICPSSELKLMAENWHKDRDLLRLLRRMLPSPPSNYGDLGRRMEAQGRWAVWDHALELERVCRQHAARWPKHLGRRGVFEAAWHHHWLKLTSGFPYFIFSSRLIQWLKVCINRFPLPRERLDLDSGLPLKTQGLPWSQTLPEEGDWALSLDHLRCAREGVALAVASFFAQDGRRGKTLRLRRALNDMWRRHAERRMLGGGEAPEPLGAVAREHCQGRDYPTPQALESAYFRLRHRVWAYSLARFGRRTNREILFTRPPAAYRQESGEEHPLRREPGVLPLAALARTRGVDYSLLGPFLAQYVLGGCVNPGRPNQPAPAGLGWELGPWLGDESLPSLLEHGERRGSRFDAACRRELEREPLAEVLEAWRGRSDPPACPAPRRREAWGRAAAWGRELAGLPAGLGPCSLLEDGAEGMPARLRKTWLIPLWWCSEMEGMPEEEVLRRLLPEDEDLSAARDYLRKKNLRRREGSGR